MTDNAGDAFHNPVFLTAMYGNRWRHYHAITSNGMFHHTPVLQPIGSTGYHYAEAWRGYAEPVTPNNHSQVKEAFEHYSAWCRRHSLVCELLRLDPLGQLRNLAGDIPNGRIVDGQPVAVLDTPDNMECYRAKLPETCRRNIRAAKRNLEIRVIAQGDISGLSAAAMLHRQTLQRVGAADKWYVRASDLQSLSTVPGFINIGVFNRLTCQLASSAGCLNENGRLHVLLVGNGLQPDVKGASDLLYEAIVSLAVESCSTLNPIQRIYFGGGRSLDGSDSLMRFKMKFSLGRTVPCSYLALIHDIKAASMLSTSLQKNPSSEPLSEIQRSCFPFLN